MAGFKCCTYAAKLQQAETILNQTVNKLDSRYFAINIAPFPDNPRRISQYGSHICPDQQMAGHFDTQKERYMRRLNKFATAALSSTMLATFAITPAYAQDAQAEEETYENEPIIVTATLRAMDVQDIPIAVTAVAPEALERQGINDIKNLASISPSFNI